MKNSLPLVVVVDDDESVRESLPDLLNEFETAVQAFSSGDELFTSGSLLNAECLILDVGMPGMSGPDIQLELKRRKHEIPIIFITAQRDDDLRSRLLDQGATACLFKPFSDIDLLAALNAALGR